MTWTKAPSSAFFGMLLVLLGGATAWGQQPINPIHPRFRPLDGDGKPASSAATVSPDVTCGSCHDTAYIRGHDAHGAVAGATCIGCHVDANVDWRQLDDEGYLPRAALRIGAPRAGNCASCHGLVGSSVRASQGGSRIASLTLGEGAIVSAAPINTSSLNLAGKDSQTTPWDVHAAKLVDCVCCHHAGNDPARVDAKKEKLAYVHADPRRPSTAEFLFQPDHRLAGTDCRECHEAEASHAFLPYRSRHFARLACQSCHIPAPLAPAAELVDETVVTETGAPLVRYRNRENAPKVDGTDAGDAAWTTPLRPLLLLRNTPDGGARLTPVNAIGRWRWTSAGKPLTGDAVARAYFEGTTYAPSIVAALDGNGDGRLASDELRLDTPAKVAVVRARLLTLGVVEPVIQGELELHALAHGVASRTHALRDCAVCHADRTSIGRDYPLVSYVPGGVLPSFPSANAGKEGYRLTGALRRTPSGGLVLAHLASEPLPGLHVLGMSRSALSNAVGFALFLAVFSALALHAVTRFVLHLRRARLHRAGDATAAGRGPPSERHRAYVFGRYERFWHWTMAASGTALIATGILIHRGSTGIWLDKTVWVHNAAAVVLMTNAFLGFFYHGVTLALRQFVPERSGFVRRMLEHVDYQARGIFYGGPHPRNAPGKKLNPLQQITYLALLNVLFPFQIASGVLMWALGQWPSLESSLGALSAIAPLHNFGAWLFLTFFVLHVYLVTTGRSVGEHLRTMVTGYHDEDQGT